MPKKQKNNKKIILVSVIGLVIVAAGTFGILALVNSENSKEESNRNPNYNSATYDENDPNKDNPDEYSYGDDKKEELEKEETAENEQNSDGTVKATIFVNDPYVDDGIISASADITNLVEEEGICTYTFTTPSGATQSISTNSVPNAHNTLCEAADIAFTETGEWKLKVSYESDTAAGESEELSFTAE